MKKGTNKIKKFERKSKMQLNERNKRRLQERMKQ